MVFHLLLVQLAMYVSKCLWEYTQSHLYGILTKNAILTSILYRLKYFVSIVAWFKPWPFKKKLEYLLEALLKNSLKISTKKSQLFAIKLQYIGNNIFIKDKRVYSKPLKIKLEDIQILKPPKRAYDCKSFVGVVNYLSMYCPNFQKFLNPIYDLTRKARPFIMIQMYQDAFEWIKTDH